MTGINQSRNVVKFEERTARVRLDNGKFQTLGLDKSTDEHLRYDYDQTAHTAQGRTADHVVIHADSRAANLVDQKMMYVGISRAKASASVYTDDRAKLVFGIKERSGVKQIALTTGVSESGKARAMGAGLG